MSVLGLEQRQERGSGGRRRRDGVVDGVPAADARADRVDLHDDLPLGVDFRVREVGAEHQQEVAAVERDRAAGLPISPDWPTWKGLSRPGLPWP